MIADPTAETVDVKRRGKRVLGRMCILLLGLRMLTMKIKAYTARVVIR